MILKVQQKKSETSNTFSLILEKPQGFTFYAGQYLDIELPVKDKLGNNRTFTISSSPTEDFLMMTSRKGVTPFKKFMEKLKKGDTINTSHPIGTFTLDESAPAVLIAGGIGITPFRSMIKYAVDKNLTTPIILIYSHSGNDFLFQEELGQWKSKINLKITFHNSAQLGRLSKLPTTNYQLPIYYLAGPPKMVDNLENILLKGGIDQTNIRTDRFDGY